jgi:Lantibiotic dehydratase, N terminus
MLDHATLRVASWPIEIVESFGCPDLADRAHELLALESDLGGRRESVRDRLRVERCWLDDRDARAYVARVRRVVARSLDPLPEPSEHVRAVVACRAALSELLVEEGGLRAELAGRREVFEVVHAQELEREQLELRRLAGTAAFRKALAVCNLQLARRWAQEPAADRRRLGRWRRVEASVLHTLMRAVGRATPSGAWAGVAAIRPGPDAAGLLIEPAPARRRAVVDLQAFRAVLRGLAGCPRYRDDGPLTLEPTLYRRAAGWSWERDRGGVREWQCLPRQPVFDAIVAGVAAGPCRAATIVESVASELDGDAQTRAQVARVVARFVESGILHTSLEAPVAATDPWAALDEISKRLADADRLRWTSCVLALRGLCDELGERYEALSPAAVEAIVDAAAGHLRDLWDGCGLAGTPPDGVIRLELHAPFEATWGEACRETVVEAVKDLLSFHAADGGAELFRQQSMAAVVAACPPGATVAVDALLRDGKLAWNVGSPGTVVRDATHLDAPETREEIFARALGDRRIAADARAHCRRWEAHTAELQGQTEATVPSASVDHAAMPGATGSLLLRIAGPLDVWLGAGRPEASAFRSCAASFPDTATAPVEASRDQLLRAHAGEVGLVRVVPDDADVGAALAGFLDAELARLLPHGASGAGLAGVRLTVDGASRPWLTGPHAVDPWVPTYDGVAAAGFGDRCARLLITLGRAHGWEFPSFGLPPSDAERTRWRYLPRLRLPGGAVLSPRRWTIGADTLAAIAAERAAARYLAWQAEVRRRGIPELVYVRAPMAPELLMRTDSALAVDALFRKLSPRARWLSVEELPGEPDGWPVRGPSGEHYLAEVAVTWVAPDHWRRVRSSDG